MDISCALCNLEFRNDKQYDQHINGKKHKLVESLKKSREDVARCSLFVSGFGKDIDSHQLEAYFEQYGNIKKLIMDHENNVFAIVEYEEESSAVKALTTNTPHKINSKTINVKKREVKEFTSNITNSSSKENKLCKIKEEALSLNMLFKNSETFDGQVEALIKFLKLDDEHIQLRYKICEDLEKHFRKHLQNEEVFLSLFGSTSNGLASKESDVDMTLVVKNSSLQEIDQVRNISKILEDFNGITKLSTILNARCPVVRFFHEKLNVHCDISINNYFAIANSRIIEVYQSLVPNLRQVIFVIRYWMNIKNLKSVNKFNNYIITWMIIFHLQRVHSLPTVKRLSEITNDENLVNGFNCAFETNIEKIKDSELKVPLDLSVNDMLKGFFDFYSSFSFHVSGEKPRIITLRDGKVVENQEQDGISKISDSINMQDPFDTAHNITANINKKTMEHFIAECQVCTALLVYGKDMGKSKNKSWGLSLLTTKKALIINSPERKIKAKSTNELHSFTLNKAHETKHVNFVLYILKECLLFEEIDLTEVVNKNKKRLKILSEICDQVDSLGIESSKAKRVKTEANGEKIGVCVESQNFQFKINNSWKGRRMTKRKIMNDESKSIEGLNSLQIERLISESIIDSNKNRIENEFINVNISKTLGASENLKINIESLENCGEASVETKSMLTSFVHFLDEYLNNCFKNYLHLVQA